MSLTPQTREELKKEFREIVSGSVRFISTRDEVSSFWLDKFDQLLIEKEGKINELEYWDLHIKDVDFAGSDGEVGYDKAKEDIINILKE